MPKIAVLKKLCLSIWHGLGSGTVWGMACSSGNEWERLQFGFRCQPGGTLRTKQRSKGLGPPAKHLLPGFAQASFLVSIRVSIRDWLKSEWTAATRNFGR